MAAFDRRMAVLGKHARMQVAVAFSVLLHAIIILGRELQDAGPPPSSPYRSRSK